MNLFDFNKVRRFIFIVCLFFSVVACAGKNFKQNHSLILINSSGLELQEVRLDYGGYYLPKGGASGMGVNIRRSVYDYMEIPEFAHIKWKSTEGDEFYKKVPIKIHVVRSGVGKKVFTLRFDVVSDDVTVLLQEPRSKDHHLSERCYQLSGKDYVGEGVYKGCLFVEDYRIVKE